MNFGRGVKSQQQIHDWRRKMKKETRGGVKKKTAWISSLFTFLLPWKKWRSEFLPCLQSRADFRREKEGDSTDAASCNSHWQKRNWQDKWRKQESKKRPLGLEVRPPASNSWLIFLLPSLPFSSPVFFVTGVQLFFSSFNFLLLFTCLSLQSLFSEKNRDQSHLSFLLWVNLLMCHPLAFSWS